MKNKLAKYSDQELVKMLKSRNKDAELAFTELYDRYSIRINAYCISILNNPDQAADIFQEVFMRFYQNVKSDKFQGSVIGFLITIARNLCLNAKRDAKTTVPIEDFEIYYSGSNQNYEDKELSELVVMAMELLEPVQKEAMVLRLFNDMKYDEIGDVLDCTAARARYLVFNGRQRIKDILKPYIKEINKII